MVQYHVISLITFWASKVIAIWYYYSIYRKSWYFYSYCFGKYDLLFCYEDCIPCFSAFAYFETCLYFILIISKGELSVQLSSASMSMTGDNSLVHGLFKVIKQMLCYWATFEFTVLSTQCIILHQNQILRKISQ